ncbi:MAG: cupin domain-containing protein [Halobacteriaceae archaeon]
MTDDLASVNPHVVRQSAAETGGEFVRFESTVHPARDAANATELPHERWGIDFAGAHVHPDQTERIEVVAGEIEVRVDGAAETLRVGEEATIPKNTAHRHWNATGDPARVIWERSPPYRTEEWAESVYALAQVGHADAEGTPKWLQLLVLFDEYPDASAYLAGVPASVQRLLALALAPLGRRLGYKGTYHREDV